MPDVPEFWSCDSCGTMQTHPTHLAYRNEFDVGMGRTYRKPCHLCDACYEAVGGSCDVEA